MPFRRLLLIDDDEEDQEIFLTAAKEASDDISCIGIVDAGEALLKLKTNAIQPEVIFLDLNMPVMNGQQFLVEIKKNPDLKDIPVIIFSTSSNLTTIQLMKELGSFDFITKPERFDQLVAILKQVLN